MSAAEDLTQAMVAAAEDLGELLDTSQPDATFTIDSLDKAIWAVRKIDQHRHRFAEATKAAGAERSRIDQWLEGERQRLATSTGHLETLLARYHADQLAEDPKRKTIRTPAGDLVARKSPDRVEVDETVFVPWAERNAEDLLNPPKPRTPAKAEIKKRVGDIMSDGQVVNADTGEFLPGVLWVDGETTYKVVTDEAVKP
jgi:hypothetical protein